MKTTQIRQRLHNYLEIASDKKVKAIYTMIEDELKSDESIWTNELKEEIDSRYQQLNEGKVKSVSAAASKKRIAQLLKSVKKH